VNTPVWLSLGSNIEREHNIRGAVAALRDEFGPLRISPVYESEAVGFKGDPFFNLVVGIETDLTLAQLEGLLRTIETDFGRRRGCNKFAPRTLDIDILTFGDWVGKEGGLSLPRDEIERYAFVLRPLSDIAPDERHPRLGRTYSELWAGFDAGQQPLWQVDFPLE